MNDSLNDLIEKITEGIANLKERTDFYTLRFNDRVWELEHPVNLYRKTRNPDAIEHMLKIFSETSSSKPEGDHTFNSSIWNANVQARGKMTTLGELFSELRELVEKKGAEEN